VPAVGPDETRNKKNKAPDESAGSGSTSAPDAAKADGSVSSDAAIKGDGAKASESVNGSVTTK
jgi:hypothetical protein